MPRYAAATIRGRSLVEEIRYHHYGVYKTFVVPAHVGILDFTFLKSRHLPSKVAPFFHMKPIPLTPKCIKPWFWDKNVPKMKLSMLLMNKANIPGNFTNYSLRVTRTTMLFDSGTTAAIIQKHTGHRSLSALRMYVRVTPQQQAMVSNILANTPSPESEQANTSKANTTLIFI